ncbi:MAG: MBL fold metallo-hydrolase [Candidatus Gracilibacteria bacterium]|jgi:metallo-beta-lactamase family protein
MKLQSFGAAREVTGSRHLLEVNGKRILLDFGMFQGHRKESDKKNRILPFDAGKIDAVILSHAHIDHSGGLPFLVKSGYKGPIYSTFATRDLCNYMLLDSAYIQEKDAQYMNEKINKKKNHKNSNGNAHAKGASKIHNSNSNNGNGDDLNSQEKTPLEPLYSVEDAEKTLKQFYGVGYERAFKVTDGVICSFYDAGHILGSALVHLVIHEKETGKRFTFAFTGDLGRKSLPILRDPQVLPPTDYLMMESTYGNRFHESILDAGKRLAEVINATAKRGGKIIIPAFSVERTQEVVYHLNLLWQKKAIPDLPIYIDSPLSANVTEVFAAHPECFDEAIRNEFINNRKNPFGFGKLQYTHSVDESKALNSIQVPAIIISASGMCENGRILHHLKNNIEDPRNTIMLVGYTAIGTLGRKIQEKQPIVNIYGDPYHLRADVVSMDAFSGHADRSDLLDYVSKVEGLKKIFLVHGEESQSETLATILRESGHANVTVNTIGEVYQIPEGDEVGAAAGAVATGTGESKANVSESKAGLAPNASKPSANDQIDALVVQAQDGEVDAATWDLSK